MNLLIQQSCCSLQWYESLGLQYFHVIFPTALWISCYYLRMMPDQIHSMHSGVKIFVTVHNIKLLYSSLMFISSSNIFLNKRQFYMRTSVWFEQNCNCFKLFNYFNTLSSHLRKIKSIIFPWLSPGVVHLYFRESSCLNYKLK